MTILPLEKSTMDVRELARQVKRARGTIVLTRRGKPVLIVQDTTGEDWETIALSTNPDFARFVNKRRQSAKKRGTLSFNEVCRKFGLRPLDDQ